MDPVSLSPDQPIRLGVLGGSGLYSFPGMKDVQEIELETPFGKPSAPVVTGLIQDIRVAFLARHGIGHHISPSEVNYRANIYAMKLLGVEQLVSISACGSLREDYKPGEIVVPDQVFDFSCSWRMAASLSAVHQQRYALPSVSNRVACFRYRSRRCDWT